MKMQNSTTRSFASRDAEIPFFVKQAQLAGGPVLEVACGTGRITLPIARAGLDVTGLDVSRPMLELARRKAEAERLRVAWVERWFFLQRTPCSTCTIWIL